MKSAFSLLEISIVLVVLALILSGIMFGRDLIRAAELRSITTEFNNIQIAITQFRTKYKSIPGDMKNATKFWGEADSDPSSCITASAHGTQTCNGDNDKVLDDASVANAFGERTMFWQHLSNGGFLNGTYSGKAGDLSKKHLIAGVNAPSSKISGAGWGVDYNNNGNSEIYDMFYGNFIEYGLNESGSDYDEAVVSPLEAYAVDKKLDDGLPAKGNLVVRFWNKCTTSNNNNDFEGNYLTQLDNISCSLMFINSNIN